MLSLRLCPQIWSSAWLRPRPRYGVEPVGQQAESSGRRGRLRILSSHRLCMQERRYLSIVPKGDSPWSAKCRCPGPIACGTCWTFLVVEGGRTSHARIIESRCCTAAKRVLSVSGLSHSRQARRRPSNSSILSPSSIQQYPMSHAQLRIK